MSGTARKCTTGIVAAAALIGALSACGAQASASATPAASAAPSAPTADNLRAYSAKYIDALAALSVTKMVAATAGDDCPVSTVTAAQAIAQLKDLNLGEAEIRAAYGGTGDVAAALAGDHGTLTGQTLNGKSTTKFTWSGGAWHRDAPTGGCDQ